MISGAESSCLSDSVNDSVFINSFILPVFPECQMLSQVGGSSDEQDCHSLHPYRNSSE